MFIKVKVFPGAQESRVRELACDRFDIYVREDPRAGMATRASVRELARHLKIGEKNIRVVRGYKTRNKIFEIAKPK